MAQYFEQPLSRDGALVCFDEDESEVVLSKHDELIKLDYEEALKLLDCLRQRELLLRKWQLRQGPWDSDEGA